MKDLSPEFCAKVREARREAGLAQSALAREVGCKQSALSMFEQGDGTKLNDEVIGKLAKRFGLEIARVNRPHVAVPVSLRAATGYCPNPNCPSNRHYQVEGRVLYHPDRAVADPIGGRYCAMCGELLERQCPNCGTPVHDGVFCSVCGQPYIVV